MSVYEIAFVIVRRKSSFMASAK